MPGFESLSENLSKEAAMERGNYQLKRFASGEIQILLTDKVKGQDCFVLGSNRPPDQQMVELLFLCHTLKKEKAKNVTVILPHLAYTRQDKNEAQKSFATDLVAKIFKAAGIDKVITVDIHSQFAEKLFKIPLVSLSPSQIFADELKKISFADAIIVAPDKGAINRVKEVKKCLKDKSPISYFEKKRDGEIISSVFKGKFGKRIVLIDDIIDTGRTLIVACQELKKIGGPNGQPDIVIMATHGLFTEESWKELWNLGVKKIYVTDTVPKVKDMASLGVSILPVAHVIKKYLEK